MLFITDNSREASRGIKFVMMEIMIILGMTSASLISSRLLQLNSEGAQLRTYQLSYYLTLALELVATGLLLVLYLQKQAQKRTEKMAAKERRENKDTQQEPENGLKAFLKVDNVRQTLVAFFRPRPNNVRLQIFLLCYVQFSQMAITVGLAPLMMQFAEKVYAWDPSKNALYQAIQTAAGMLMLAAMSGVFITWLKLKDSTLILMAQISNFSSDLIRGTFLSPLATFIALPFGKNLLTTNFSTKIAHNTDKLFFVFAGCLNGFGIVCAKAKFTKIVPKEDAGKIFTLNALIEGLVPLGTSIIYTNIFRLSLGTYPGLVYHFSCFLMIFTVIALIIEKRFCPVTGQEMEEEEDVPENFTDTTKC